jgi:ankyrin repeat protein
MRQCDLSKPLGQECVQTLQENISCGYLNVAPLPDGRVVNGCDNQIKIWENPTLSLKEQSDILLAMTKDTSLRTLDLSHISLKKLLNGLEYLEKILKNHPSLTTLDLRHTDLTDQEFLDLLPAIKKANESKKLSIIIEADQFNEATQSQARPFLEIKADLEQIIAPTNVSSLSPSAKDIENSSSVEPIAATPSSDLLKTQELSAQEKTEPEETKPNEKTPKDPTLLDAVGKGELSTVKRLAANGESLYAKTVTGQSALMLAAHAGHLEIVQWLTQQGAYLNEREKSADERTALIIAVQQGHLEIVQWLVEQSENHTERYLENAEEALMLAQQKKQPAITQWITQWRQKQVFLRSADMGDVETIKYAIAVHTNFTFCDQAGNTVLHRAVTHQQLPVVKAFVEADLGLLFTTNTKGETPLAIAEKQENEELIQYLAE